MDVKTLQPYLHLSIDDVISPLKDITKHEFIYQSVFDQAEFHTLKALHDRYGAVFTLNLFQYDGEDTEHSAFCLSRVTDRFKDEFEAAAGWLKFAYHSEYTMTYSAELTPDMLEDSVKRMYDAIDRFAGAASIDRMPRFGFFSVSAEGLIRLKRGGYINGCLTADDDRAANCGLSGRELYRMRHQDSCIDSHGILYVRSEHRFDNLNRDEIITLLDRLNGDESNNKCFIIFGHSIDAEKMRVICEWAVARHIPFGYPHDTERKFV